MRNAPHLISFTLIGFSFDQELLHILPTCLQTLNIRNTAIQGPTPASLNSLTLARFLDNDHHLPSLASVSLTPQVAPIERLVSSYGSAGQHSDIMTGVIMNTTLVLLRTTRAEVCELEMVCRKRGIKLNEAFGTRLEDLMLRMS